jgi:hypothetical protein
MAHTARIVLTLLAEAPDGAGGKVQAQPAQGTQPLRPLRLGERSNMVHVASVETLF